MGEELITQNRYCLKKNSHNVCRNVHVIMIIIHSPIHFIFNMSWKESLNSDSQQLHQYQQSELLTDHKIPLQDQIHCIFKAVGGTSYQPSCDTTSFCFLLVVGIHIQPEHMFQYHQVIQRHTLEICRGHILLL